ncbi:L(3)mbt interactor in ovarian somatic cells isoform X2 [Rhynchophorus ferrugineus]|uniref:Uncharacterized protein n=1 Tax=Rhynchophorus ferrugineus TaxID=354439 RepID=A0A834M478_RHYFE|nr:hypothetical protein GWI33_015707 [Rhynchophorus ferrugineus]
MNSPTARNRERILEAIDQLRKRKARPDFQRICSYLFRRFHVNSADAKADLEWCVANNIVLKVEYKGSISYRNAAKKWAQMRNRDTNAAAAINPLAVNKQTISQNFMDLLINVFGELIVYNPDYLELGVPPREIIDNILSKDSVRYTRNYVAILLVKEVERGNLIKLESGNFLLGSTAEDGSRQGWMSQPQQRADSSHVLIQTDDADAAEKQHVAVVKHKKRMIAKVQAAAAAVAAQKQNRLESGDDKKLEAGSVRLGGRRKKAKKVFDPSDTHVPRKRGRPAGSLNRSTIEKNNIRKDEDSRPDSRTSTSSREQGGVCSVCHTQNKRGPNERMVACKECSNKAHFSCLNGDDMMLKMYPDNSWQCPHCKTCVVCDATSDAGMLIVCSVCADGYHFSCHQPRVLDKPKNSQRWLCKNCHVTDELKLNDIQSNIGDSITTHKISINESENDKEVLSQSNSISARSSPVDSRASSPLPPQLSPQNNPRSDTPDREAHSDTNSVKDSEPDDPNIDPSIPDATHWTPEEVYQYFAQYFPEEAKVFKEQEIDGRSLLLLKRMDVLTNLNLKLGPALKIYRHVTMLQVRRDDRSLYWL